MSDTQGIGALERITLALVFARPTSWWVAAARLFWIKVVPAQAVDDALLSDAEAQARVSARRFQAGLVAGAISFVVIALWAPVQGALLLPLVDVGFDAVAQSALASGLSHAASGQIANVVLTIAIAVVALLNVLVLCAVPVHLFRGSVLAAAPAVSIALAHRAEPIGVERLLGYPRVAFAMKTVLGRRYS